MTINEVLNVTGTFRRKGAIVPALWYDDDGASPP